MAPHAQDFQTMTEPNDRVENGRVDFDGGDTGCGELLLDLLLFMKRQAPGSRIKVRALDPGAPLEIPAWCRLTHHELLDAQHPIYIILKPTSTDSHELKEDQNDE
jgi:tRNA 2-thiouridine synthesizing protein A